MFCLLYHEVSWLLSKPTYKNENAISDFKKLAVGKLEAIPQPKDSIHTFRIIHPGGWVGARTGGNWLLSVAVVKMAQFDYYEKVNHNGENMLSGQAFLQTEKWYLWVWK